LTELLVVIAILAVLTVMTAAAINFGFAAERSRSAARQVQSYLAGARDRAIYEKHPVGVRYLLDPTIPGISTSMVFIEEVDPPTGTVRVSLSSGIWTAQLPPGNDQSWINLRRTELLKVGDQIRLPDPDGFWYTVQEFPSDTTIRFEPEFRLPGGKTYQFKLKLQPVVRANQEPMLLPLGIAIDLDRSQVPRSWRIFSGPSFRYTTNLDVMFSPRGTVTGKAASGGLIHFYVAEMADVERLANFPANRLAVEAPHIPAAFIPASQLPSEPASGTPPLVDPMGDRVIVTLFPQTGAISSHPVDVTDVNKNGVCDDPFFFAETGEVAGK
jgi:type II secretory pathway pseudopilin PulG